MNQAAPYLVHSEVLKGTVQHGRLPVVETREDKKIICQHIVGLVSYAVVWAGGRCSQRLALQITAL